MRLEGLEIRGLRRYGPETTVWELNGASYLIIGPANAGKSALAGALYWAVHGPHTAEDFFGLSAPSSISIRAQL